MALDTSLVNELKSFVSSVKGKSTPTQTKSPVLSDQDIINELRTFVTEAKRKSAAGAPVATAPSLSPSAQGITAVGTVRPISQLTPSRGGAGRTNIQGQVAETTARDAVLKAAQGTGRAASELQATGGDLAIARLRVRHRRRRYSRRGG